MSDPNFATPGLANDTHSHSGRLDRSTDLRHVGSTDYVVQPRPRGAVKIERYDLSAKPQAPADGGRLLGGQLGVMVETSSVLTAGDTTLVPIPQPSLRAPASTLVPSEPPAPSLGVMVVAPPPRVKVTLKGTAFGKTTLFCSGVAVSDSLVVIQYPNDGQTTIVEPPVCGAEDPLTVSHDGKTYRCLSGEWAAELNGQYLVVLIRLPDSASPVA